MKEHDRMLTSINNFKDPLNLRQCEVQRTPPLQTEINNRDYHFENIFLTLRSKSEFFCSQMVCIVCLINLLKYLRQGVVQAPANPPATD